MKIIGSMLCLIVFCLSGMMITGCGTYSEGDLEARKAFDLMTAREIAMHNKVDSEFYESTLMGLRSSIVNCRSEKPSEKHMPFSDVAAMVVYTNDVETSISTTWSQDHMRRAANAKFAGQDPVWYKTICTIAAINSEENGVTHETLLKKKLVSAAITVDQVKQYEETKEKSRYLTEGEIQSITREMSECEEAKDLFKSLISLGKPLTFEDGDKLKSLNLVCAAKRAQEEMED